MWTIIKWLGNMLLMGPAYALGSTGSIFVSLAGLLVDVGYNLNAAILSFAETGFRISLSVANLGFVLALIIMAFATILRYEEYGVKKLLGKLILAAVLVNFSMLIAGVFIDFSQVVTGVFIGESARAGLGAGLATIIQPQGVLVAPSFATARAAAFFSAAHLTLIAGAYTTAIFTWIAAIVIAAIGVMFIYRFFKLTILVILMPLAWMFYPMPRFNSHTKKWWDAFLKQIFSFPAIGFFLFLAMRMASRMNEEIGNAVAGDTRLNAITAGLALVDTLFASGLLVGALLAANTLGAAGADKAMKFAIAARNKAVSWGKGVGKEVARGTLATAGAKKAAGGISTLLTKPGIRAVPGAKGLANILAGKAQRKNEVEEYQKTRLSNLSDSQFESFMKNPPAGAVAKAAVLAEAVKRKKTGELAKNIGIDEADPEKAKKLKTAHLRSYVEAARSANPGMQIDKIPDVQSILDANPEMAYDLVGKELMEKDVTETAQKIATAQKRGEDTSKLEEALKLIKDAQSGNTEAIKETTRKMTDERVKKMSSSKAAELSKDSLKDKNVALALNQYQISSIMKESQEKTDVLKETFEKSLGSDKDPSGKTLPELNETLAKLSKGIREAKNSGDEGKVKSLQEGFRILTIDRDKLIKKGTGVEQEEKKAAYERLELINRKPGGYSEF